LAYEEETVSVEQLFEEELAALEYHYNKLVKETTDPGATKAAESLLHVIAYFRVRLGQDEEDFETLYGAYPDRTIH